MPIETWSYCSPELRAENQAIDVGLFAEAIIYYETVGVIISNQTDFSEFCRWFIENGTFDELIELLENGSLLFYEYAFITAEALITTTGCYDVFHLVDGQQDLPNSFERRYLNDKQVVDVIPDRRQRERLFKSVAINLIEIKASQVGRKILDDGTKEILTPSRSAVIVQAFVDHVYQFRGLNNPPDVQPVILLSAHLVGVISELPLSRSKFGSPSPGWKRPSSPVLSRGRRVLTSTAILRPVLRTGNVQVARRSPVFLTCADRLDLSRGPLHLRQGIST